MELEAQCVRCLKEKEQVRAVQIEDKKLQKKYLAEIKEIIDKKLYRSPPEYLDAFSQIFMEKYGEVPSYGELKTKYNQFLLQEKEEIISLIKESKDTFKAAIQAAQAGNYIDFIAMDGISEEKLKKLLLNFRDKDFDMEIYESFKRDLDRARKVVYFTDNCGEIVLDKILIQMIQKKYPQINVHVIVRGSEVGNDVTMEDAIEVKLNEVAEVMGNGTTIAGTCLHRLPKRVSQIVDNADVIIAKGQGNYETLNGCGKNIYYLFLCKCNYFIEKFNTEYLAPVFCKENERSSN
ncbi:MAG: damage-control phosphatase ARMT1 family protein [Anaerostipes sp.]